MSSTTGSNTRLCRRANLMRDPHAGLRSAKWTSRSFETASATQTVSTQDPQRIQREVLYETTVGMPSSRSPPSGFGIVTRRTGCGRYVPARSWSRMAGHSVRSRAAVWSMSRPSTPAAPLLARTRFHASSRFSRVRAASSSPDPVLSASERGRRVSSRLDSDTASPCPCSNRPACTGI